MAEEETGKYPFFGGQVFYGKTQAVEAIDQGSQELAVAGAHLPVLAEEIFQPGVQGHPAFVSEGDLGGVTELVVEFHYSSAMLPDDSRSPYNSNRALTGSLPNSS